MLTITRAAICMFGAFYFSTSVLADQVSEFQAIVKTCKASMDARPSVEVFFNKSSLIWSKKVYAPSTVTYDVKRTESLVSPVSGFIEVIEEASIKTSPDEESANALEVSPEDASTRTVRIITRIDYLHSGGKWALSGGQNSFLFRGAGQKHFDRNNSKNQYTPEKLAGFDGPIKGCIKQ